MQFQIHSEVLEIQSTAPAQKVDWGVSLVQAPEIWSLTKGDGMKIAVLDTGIDHQHPDLQANFVKGVNFTTADTADHMDRQGHGKPIV